MQYNSLIIFISGLLFSVSAEGSNEGSYEQNYSYNEDYEDTKEILYRDFEGNSTVTYDQTSKGPSIKRFSFTYIKGVLNVTFTPFFVGENYTVFLEAKNFVIPRKHVTNAKHEQSLTYGRHEVVEDPYYVVRIICSCEAEDFKSEPFVVGAYKTEELDCRSWNINISLNAVPNKHTITMRLVPAQEYELCFKIYTAELFRFDGKCQKGDKSLNKTKDAAYNSKGMIVIFEDLFPANYCAVVTAKHQNCQDGICGERTYTSKELPELEKSDPILLQDEKVDLIVIIIPLSALAIVCIVGIIGARRIKSHLIYKLQGKGKSLQEEEGHESIAGNEETVIVPIINAQCVEQQHQVVTAIYDFLKDCCNVHPIIADDNPELFLNSSAWIQKNFNYEQLLNEKVLHKVLILETDAAVRLYEHWSRLGEDGAVTLPYHNYSHLNDIFLRELTQLLSNPEFLGVDHYHFIVVRFPYCTNELSCFKQKRLCLPFQAVELYNSLWNKSNLHYDEENLTNKWKENETYKRLCKTINQMENYVTENPSYLDNCIFGQTQTG